VLGAHNVNNPNDMLSSTASLWRERWPSRCTSRAAGHRFSRKDTILHAVISDNSRAGSVARELVKANKRFLFADYQETSRHLIQASPAGG
jgi:hypothetical protein